MTLGVMILAVAVAVLLVYLNFDVCEDCGVKNCSVVNGLCNSCWADKYGGPK